MQFRCASRMHFVMTSTYIEVKCKSKRCGAGAGVVILHRFNKTTGELLETLKFQDPAALLEKEGINATHHSTAAVRSA